MERWRLIVDEGLDPRLNLAIEETIARRVGAGLAPPTVRLWTSSPSVMLGISQDMRDEANLVYCEENDIRIVRRFTGGGAVFLDEGNLNFSIAVRKGDRLLPKDISQSYAKVAEGVIEALRTLGLEARFSKDEIQIAGLKISGMAGANEFGAIFRHGTLIVSTDPRKIYESLNRIKREVTNLSLSAAREISIHDVVEVLPPALESKFGILLDRGGIGREATSEAHVIFKEKYSSSEWNMREAQQPIPLAEVVSP